MSEVNKFNQLGDGIELVKIHHKDMDEVFDDAYMFVNIGPSHPAMHGTLRVMARLNGEVIEKSVSEMGYLHRGKEKIAENTTYHKFIPHTDRMNYCSALCNNVAYTMAVERLLGLEVPERTKYIRTICIEIARIIDHLICVGINAVDIGAFSFFLYGFHHREEAYTLIEMLCGARLTTSYSRIGGLAYEPPEEFLPALEKWIDNFEPTLNEMDKLLTNNRIWKDRTIGVGAFTKEQAMAYSFTGPCARASNINIDLRRDQPNPLLKYDEVQFDVPIAQNGDVYDRYLVRMEEIRQSLRILRQLAKKCPKTGPIWVEDKRVRIPDKERIKVSMEALIHHFKFFMEGFDVPPGEAYTNVEGPNGEIGFYIVSKGGPRPWRTRVRAPSFWMYQSLDEMCKGQKIADLIASLGSINIIAGELDR
jgi:NADH dehydrogenase I D subunit